MAEINYKQGNTVVWSDGEKLVVRNTAGKSWIETNIEQIFGKGEYDKILEHKHSYTETRNRINRASKTVEIVSAYIPDRVENDLKKKEEGQLSKDQMKKYFGDLV